MDGPVLSRAVNERTLDGAVRLIQGALGIEWGDTAGMHFGGDIVENERRWTHGSGSDRASMLSPWLVSEMLAAGFDGPVESTDEAKRAAVLRDR